MRFWEETDVRIRVNIKGICEKNNLTMGELSRRTDIEPSKISAYANNHRQRVQLSHLERICQSLHIRDMNELFVLEVLDDEQDKPKE
ncbi:helix-turn-helix transcriptional regulator [Listeria innocua]|nr:helix-turn-helix transcriptional regulator [Listeria innocua]EKD7152028.1 helix-turn-helix transcriptional regulator [Listeria innocua]EKK7208469.1 helix-turn-helix transcriptional regulator [Listeria innocua]HBN5051458.1 helix-turn-helix transcriptional regulator [Listeria innocua]